MGVGGEGRSIARRAPRRDGCGSARVRMYVWFLAPPPKIDRRSLPPPWPARRLSQRAPRACLQEARVRALAPNIGRGRPRGVRAGSVPKAGPAPAASLIRSCGMPKFLDRSAGRQMTTEGRPQQTNARPA